MGTTEGAREGIWEKERNNVLVVVVVFVIVVAVVAAVVVHNAGEAPIFFWCCYCMVVSCGLLQQTFFLFPYQSPYAPRPTSGQTHAAKVVCVHVHEALFRKGYSKIF